MANGDTRPTTDNTGGVPTEAALIEYLQDVDRPVSLDQLAKATGATRDGLKVRVESLEERGLIIVSMGLYYVTVRLVNGVQPIADGGTPTLIDAVGDDLNLTPAEVHTVLANERRRETISVLARQAQQDGSEETYVSVSSLSTSVCAAGGSDRADIAPDDRHATYVTLTQTHLPLLHDFGVVEYYRRVKKVHPTETTSKLDKVLTAIDDICGGGADAQ